MNKLSERMRRTYGLHESEMHRLANDGADEIERLTAENERLRKLLDAVANQGWQEIDDDLRRQIRAYQQNAPRCSRCGENHSPRCE